MFFNEQAFREGALKGVEGIVSNENAIALMMSFNRLGVVWSSASTALTTQVIRNEWGFKGMIETDGVAGGSYKSHFPSSLAAGVTTYCIDPGNTAAAGIKKQIEDNDDGDMLGYLRTSMKNFHYALTRTSLINGLDANAKVVKVTPWWRYAIFGCGVCVDDAWLRLHDVAFRTSRQECAGNGQGRIRNRDGKVRNHHE